MRRAPNPGADRAAQNSQTLKTLVKIESNKTCADCKRNKHPRWASWNLGIFICIRCSGIHRGMGTHISRVKSVDLDAWTDEQLASMLKWGNARANTYWEAKLAAGHVPAEAKIENFIRTKYDSKRWVMDGGMPDPSTLDVGGDDDVPLNVVQQKATIERASSLRQAPAPTPSRASQDVDLFGDPIPAPRSTSAAPATAARAPPPPQQAPQQQQPKPRTGGDSLLGFDFLSGASSNPPSRPASSAATAATTATSSGPSRGDLKQSILSLYASVPKSTPAPPAQNHSRTGSAAPSGNALGGLSDDFGSLSFGSPAATPLPPSSITSPTLSAASRVTSPPPATAKPAGGNFFDSKPAAPRDPPPVQAPARPARGLSSSSGFGDFGDFATAPMSPPLNTTSSKPAKANNGLSNDLFDFSSDPTPAPARPLPSNPPPIDASAFNLSAPKPAPPKATPVANAPASVLDPWGSGDVWASNAPPTPTAAPSSSAMTNPPPLKSPAAAPAPSFGNEWGNDAWSAPAAAPAAPATTTAPAKPRVTADEDFGGWASSTAPAVPASAPAAAPAPSGKPAEDPFDNPWG